MANRRSALDEATERWRRAWLALADELREARLMLGLTQAQVAAALGVSRTWVGRVERRRVAHVSSQYLFRHAAVVGLKAYIKLFPLGGALRDQAQLRYEQRFVERVGHAWRAQLDVPVPIAGDLRAIDIYLTNAACRICVEVITRLRDVQAQIRAAQLKQRDIGAERVILVIAATRANREALAQARGALFATFDMDARRVMRALTRGEDPGRDAVILFE